MSAATAVSPTALRPRAVSVHPLLWLGWLALLLAWLLATRNPLYLALLLLCLALVEAALPTRHDQALPISPWRMALFIVPFSALFNALVTPIGERVLFRWPAWLPILQGPVTAEAVVFGASNGLVLVGMIAAFTCFVRALSTHELIRLMPRAFQPVAVTAALALTFVPSTIRHFQQIREAQAVRGHRLRGIRDWLPLLIPLLIGGMERAYQLAEAMTARGFASQSQPLMLRDRAALLLALLAIATGWIADAAWIGAAWGAPLALVGLALLLALLWSVGRRVPQSQYRRHAWQPADLFWFMLLALAALPVLPLSLLPRNSLVYTPYPQLTWPPFDIRLALLMMFVLLPIAWRAAKGGRVR